MIAKKSSKADLERKRFAFFQIGLVVAGAATLLAFEYRSVTVEQKKVALAEERPSWIAVEDELVDEEILQTRPQPQQTSFQTQPEDEVIIATTPVVGQFLSQIIVINDPCVGCDDEPLTWVDDTQDGEIIDIPGIDPSFPGGDVAMKRFIVENTQYPDIALQLQEEGTVYVQFVVNTDGSICQVKALNKLYPSLVTEAERVVSIMPNWIPGEQAGKKVRVRYTIPINFEIR